MKWAKRDHVFTFKFFDDVKKTWKKSNSTEYESLERFRKFIMKDKRYLHVGDIYERDISKPCVY